MSDKDDIVSQYEKDTIFLNGSEIVGIHKERKLDPHIMKSTPEYSKLNCGRAGTRKQNCKFL